MLRNRSKTPSNSEMKQVVLKNALGIEEPKEPQQQSYRKKVQELEEQLKDKEEYINFLTGKPLFEEKTCTPAIDLQKLSELKEDLVKMRENIVDIKKVTENNKAAMNEVWQHLTNIMINQCKKAEQLQKKYKALANERQILINEIGKLKAKVQPPSS